MKIVKIPFNKHFTLTSGLPIGLFKNILDLMPSDTKFVGCNHDIGNFTDYMFFTSDSFIETADGNIIPSITPYFKTNSGTITVTHIDFGQALVKDNCNHQWQSYSGLYGGIEEFCNLCNTKKI